MKQEFEDLVVTKETTYEEFTFLLKELGISKKYFCSFIGVNNTNNWKQKGVIPLYATRGIELLKIYKNSNKKETFDCNEDLIETIQRMIQDSEQYKYLKEYLRVKSYAQVAKYFNVSRQAVNSRITYQIESFQKMADRKSIDIDVKKFLFGEKLKPDSKKIVKYNEVVLELFSQNEVLSISQIQELLKEQDKLKIKRALLYLGKKNLIYSFSRNEYCSAAFREKVIGDKKTIIVEMFDSFYKNSDFPVCNIEYFKKQAKKQEKEVFGNLPNFLIKSILLESKKFTIYKRNLIYKSDRHIEQFMTQEEIVKEILLKKGPLTAHQVNMYFSEYGIVQITNNTLNILKNSDFFEFSNGLWKIKKS